MSTPTNASPEPNDSDLPRYNAPQNQNPYAQEPGRSAGQPDGGDQYPGSQYQQSSGQKIKGTPPLWLGITLAVAGPLLGILMLVISVVAVSGTVQEMADAQSGTTQTLEAEQSYWVLSGDPAVSDATCSVYDAQANSIPFEANTSTATTTSTDSGQSATVLGTFTSTDAGEYDIYCSGVASSDLYVAQADVGGLVGGAVGILGGILLGGLLFLVGIVLIIINRVTASRRRRAAGMA